jgi:hypothetical protein
MPGIRRSIRAIEPAATGRNRCATHRRHDDGSGSERERARLPLTARIFPWVTRRKVLLDGAPKPLRRAAKIHNRKSA